MTFLTESLAAFARTGALGSKHAHEALLSVLGLGLTLFAAVVLTSQLSGEAIDRLVSGHLIAGAEQSVFLLIVVFLIYGNVVYQLARFGHYWRQHQHRPKDRDELERIYKLGLPPASLTILVPSYREERDVIWQTLMSAALMEWPNRRVVLLLDDPPNPRKDEDQRVLTEARALPKEIQSLLREPARRYRREQSNFQSRLQAGKYCARDEAGRLSGLYEWAADWLDRQAGNCPQETHTDRLFVQRILEEPARRHRERAQQLRQETLSSERAEREFCRLASLFQAEISSFERKQFVNLSHEPNKAMNLNAYISLMGRSFRIRRQAYTKLIEEVPPALADLHIADADYLITLDADSIVLPDYALRLVRVIEESDNERLAVVQTPYTAVPEAGGALERVAGATTDIQHIIHQGFTQWHGTYWVGANALLRRRALEDIKTVHQERGFRVEKYIESRTVIEDTESSIDLINKGWSLHNYPDRLAYSATPSDFGSLLVQRRRWANGGLIILPKLIRYLVQRPFKWRKLAEVFVRAHYLVSIAATSCGVLLLVVFPFEQALQTVWLPMTALPYFLLYGRDLVKSGYRWLDLPRVYALNLALIPVNMGGVWASVRQALTGNKMAFERTPKVSERTATPTGYLTALYALFFWCVFGGTMDVLAGQWLHATFALTNGGFLGYALLRFIGLRATAADFSAQLQTPAQEFTDRFRRKRPLRQGGRAS